MCRLGCDYAGDATSFADSFLRFARAEEAALEGGDCSHLVGSFARDMPENECLGLANHEFWIG